jgi:hypothetical protein
MMATYTNDVPPWEDFSAFSDLFEIEHVIEMLADWCEAYPQSQEPVDYKIGEKSLLIERLNLQASEMERVLEHEKPGLYRRTWYAGLFGEMFVRLYELAKYPGSLKDELPWLKDRMYRSLIAAHEVFDPAHRAMLIAKAACEAAGGAIANRNKAAAKKGRASKGIEAAIHWALKDGSSSVPKTAEQVWRKLEKYDLADALECGDFSVYVSDGELTSVYRTTGKPDGRPIKKASFNRAFARAKKVLP